MVQAGKADTAPGMRRDAARNRARILAAATQAFAAHGCDADVREIAHRAGVGMGTLYRHFATKQALLDTALAHDVDDWAQAARAAATTEDAWAGLRRFMTDALTRQVAHRGLRERFASSSEGPADLDACRRQLHPIMVELVARAHAEGSLRADVTADDIALLLIGLGRITEVTDGSTPGAWRRQLDLVLDGLRTPGGATIAETSAAQPRTQI